MRQFGPPTPVTRLRRGAKLGRLLGAEAMRAYGTKAANVARPAAARDAADERRRLEAAEHTAQVLGQMKGAAMKGGQMASLIDLGRLPEDQLEGFQSRLATLQDSAVQVPFKRMERVIESDLGAPLTELFADFEPTAVASASIGQVYRGRLRD